MIKFLKIDAAEASLIADNKDEIYTPAYNIAEEYFFYKDTYSEEDPTAEMDEIVADGLTPINPTKPMFPRK